VKAVVFIGYQQQRVDDDVISAEHGEACVGMLENASMAVEAKKLPGNRGG
jgi:hypothetical protein